WCHEDRARLAGTRPVIVDWRVSRPHTKTASSTIAPPGQSGASALPISLLVSARSASNAPPDPAWLLMERVAAASRADPACLGSTPGCSTVGVGVVVAATLVVLAGGGV